MYKGTKITSNILKGFGLFIGILGVLIIPLSLMAASSVGGGEVHITQLIITTCALFFWGLMTYAIGEAFTMLRDLTITSANQVILLQGMKRKRTGHK